METFGWTLSIESSEEDAKWGLGWAAGRGLKLNFQAEQNDTTATIQLRQERADLTTSLVLLGAQPLRETLEQLVKRLTMWLYPCESDDEGLYTMLGFACRGTDGVKRCRAETAEDIRQFNDTFVSFCAEQKIPLVAYREVAMPKDKYTQAAKLCAIVPADEYELTVALFVGQRIIPITRGS